MSTNLSWAKDTAERVLVTAVETALAVGFVDGTNILPLDWKAGLAVVVSTSVAAFAKAVIAKFKGDPTSASLAE
jgi:hypothetical protein